MKLSSQKGSASIAILALGAILTSSLWTGPILDTKAKGSYFDELEISLTSLSQPIYGPVLYEKVATITAYSSTYDQTDDTPFTTAANTRVRDGVVASNFLPLHSKIQIPELFGEKVFVVEDRMNRRYNDRVDIWFPTRAEAKIFGKKTATILILENDSNNYTYSNYSNHLAEL